MTSTATATRPRRRRPPFRSVEVIDVRRLNRRLAAVSFTGELEEFALEAPTQHIKMLFPGPGEHQVPIPRPGPDGPVWPVDQPRPAIRTYTPRNFDPATGVLEVQFVIHGEGPASSWADRALPGDRLAIAGPGGRLSLELTSGPWVIAGDESAIPAVGTLLEALPPGATADIFIETDEPIEGGLPDGSSVASVTWLLRAATDLPGDQLHRALASGPATGETTIWVACESTAVRQIRRTLLEQGQVGEGRLVTRGYWRAGESDHPDHDHGEDG